MSREAEVKLYSAWDHYLAELFEPSLPKPTKRRPEQMAMEEVEAKERYLDRIGQDLESFHQRLSDIMEKDRRG